MTDRQETVSDLLKVYRGALARFREDGSNLPPSYLEGWLDRIEAAEARRHGEALDDDQAETPDSSTWAEDLKRAAEELELAETAEVTEVNPPPSSMGWRFRELERAAAAFAREADAEALAQGETDPPGPAQRILPEGEEFVPAGGHPIRPASFGTVAGQVEVSSALTQREASVADRVSELECHLLFARIPDAEGAEVGRNLLACLRVVREMRGELTP